jgi:hypothetical protein
MLEKYLVHGASGEQEPSSSTSKLIAAAGSFRALSFPWSLLAGAAK